MIFEKGEISKFPVFQFSKIWSLKNATFHVRRGPCLWRTTLMVWLDGRWVCVLENWILPLHGS